jgi:hypothetical protein
MTPQLQLIMGIPVYFRRTVTREDKYWDGCVSAKAYRVSSEALTDEGGGAQRRVVDGVTDARNNVRAAR